LAEHTLPFEDATMASSKLEFRDGDPPLARLPAHPATVAQASPAHPATVVQQRPAHAATVAPARPAHPATAAQARPAQAATARAATSVSSEPVTAREAARGSSGPAAALATSAALSASEALPHLEPHALIRVAEERWRARAVLQPSLVARGGPSGPRVGGGGGGKKPPRPPPFDLKHIKKARERKKLRFHVTRIRHFLSILAGGLDPMRGGRGGASEAVGEQQFIDNSRNVVHYSNNVGLARFYYRVLEESAQGPLDLPIVFAIRRDPRFRERRDRDDDRGALVVRHRIQPSDLIVLEAEDIGFQRDDDDDYTPPRDN
jgi:hypothetical protein